MGFIHGRAITLHKSHVNEPLPCTNVSRETFVPDGDYYWCITQRPAAPSGMRTSRGAVYDGVVFRYPGYGPYVVFIHGRATTLRISPINEPLPFTVT
jgi:hypothetical protein